MRTPSGDILKMDGSIADMFLWRPENWQHGNNISDLSEKSIMAYDAELLPKMSSFAPLYCWSVAKSAPQGYN